MRSQEIILNEIKAWSDINPLFKSYFIKEPIRTLIEICAIVTLDHPLREELIINFVTGLTALPMFEKTKDERYAFEFEKLTKPVFDQLKEKITSDDYRNTLIDTEISGEGMLQINDVSIPISAKEILLHIRRINATPIIGQDIAEIERDWLKYKRNQYSNPINENTSNLSGEAENEEDNRPHFCEEEINTIFNLLKNHFSIKHHKMLLEILKSGKDSSVKLLFNSSGNKLADAMKQLYDSDIITGCQKTDLESWIERNFSYKHRGKIKEFTASYLNLLISTKQDMCHNPIMNVKKDKATGRYVIGKA